MLPKKKTKEKEIGVDHGTIALNTTYVRFALQVTMIEAARGHLKQAKKLKKLSGQRQGRIGGLKLS